MNSLMTVFSTVVGMSMTASYVALGVILIRQLLKRAPKIFSYLLWLAVFFRLVCPGSFTSVFSFLNVIKPAMQPDALPEVLVMAGLGNINDAINGTVNSSVGSTLPLVAAMDVSPLSMMMLLGSMVWMAGVMVLLIWNIFSYFKIAGKIKTATLLDASLPDIYETDQISTPFVFGFRRPRIYLPAGISPRELPYVLAHETVHIKRRDYLIKPAAFLVLIIHWFNPLMWFCFALMVKDMEMSCDETVIRNKGQEIKEDYSNSLLALAVQKNSFWQATPLAFGANNIKERIKNVIHYRKPGVWIGTAAVVMIVALMIGFVANPVNDTAAGQETYAGYAVDKLLANKTPYVGNASKVIALIDAMPLPKGVVRDKVELQTSTAPYGLTIQYRINDDSAISAENGMIGDVFGRNAILLFSLVDNVEVINIKFTDSAGKYEGYSTTYLRSRIEQIMQRDVRVYAESADLLKELLTRLEYVYFSLGNEGNTAVNKAKQIELCLEKIMSSPLPSSNPYDYIKAHQAEYNIILAMDEQALPYLFSEFAKGGQTGLKGSVMEILCRKILGSEDIKYASTNHQDWYDAYKAHTQRLTDKNGLDWMQAHYPKGVLILRGEQN
ncbi:MULTISPECIES: M56 family metallopeptidase [unclassified Dehalobacter]|uniref:M56 family metallopeptidase n=1 Tax=unclassified Dehalobacter TaxID=2635733 RepID=UPI000E6C4A61|nr:MULTISPECIES: M56 family metallopeptidase [unclassified Dehalobacter]RJE49274.1 regulator [Dehalobacter sp. MCB1]TCX53323.1 regulator [Dehalobacter sp. 14DCB1]TCX54337.1 regulator [Dehalobacter sp. 12DCB1]